MDILIPNMEMPSCCDKCFIYEYGKVEGVGYCGLLESITPPKGRKHKDCPLIELPEHGDLIDRDEAIEAVRSVKDPSGTRTALLVSRIKRIPSVVEGEVSTAEGEETR